MKKYLFAAVSVIAVMLFNIIIASNISKENTSIAQLMEIRKAQAEDPSLWYKSTGDCSITLEGEAGVIIELFGTQYTIPSSGSLTLTFHNVEVSCSSGGTYQCSTYTCADFWKG